MRGMGIRGKRVWSSDRQPFPYPGEEEQINPGLFGRRLIANREHPERSKRSETLAGRNTEYMSAIERARLRLKLGWAYALLWVAGAGRTGEAKPEVHLYLADLHFRLAAAFDASGKRSAAERHRRIANAHAGAGPPPELPPAAAMAMACPREPIFTDARGKWVETPPDDVA